MFWKYNIWGILWILLIFIACSTPGDQLPPSPFLDFDKLVHLGFYGLLQLVLLRGFLLQTRLPWIRRNYLFLSFVFSAVYGIFIEVWQGYVLLNRSFDWLDMAANIVGAILGLLSWIFLFRKKMKVRNNS